MKANESSTDHVASLRKRELHAHLNGLVSPSLVHEILLDERVKVPNGFDIPSDLERRKPCVSLAAYLKPWQVLRLIPSRKENFQRMSEDAFRRLRESNVDMVELRSSLIYLSILRNCAVHEALAELIEVTGHSAAAHGIARGIILTVTRGDYSTVQLETLLSAYRCLGCPSAVVGIDLAGDEEVGFPAELPERFRMAKDKYGLGLTVHAGETGRTENIRAAIHDFRADRIGHGTAAQRDPHLMDELRDRDICIEVCPISNRLTGAIQGSDVHPLTEFHQWGVPFVICSDNPGIHGRGLNDDYEEALKEGISFEFLRGLYDLSAKYSFLKTEP